MDGTNEMPLYDKGSRGSEVEDLGTGKILLLDHAVETVPLKKTFIKKTM
jgi:hypothetical protein